MLRAVLQSVSDSVRQGIDRSAPELRSEEVGTVMLVEGGIARVRGLLNVTSEELVRLSGKMLGVAIDLRPDDVGVMLLGRDPLVLAGGEVRALGREADAPVGEGLLGRVVDATGRPLDGGGGLELEARWPIERHAPAIMDRASVSVPLHTGIKAVDALIPIGRGQRELIIGDRQTGKTSVAVDAIVNQADDDMVCVYCAIGQQATAVARVVETLTERGAAHRTVVVVASDDEPPGLRFVTPYAATTMAEYFMEQGRDVLVVYDDLTRHARAYRELSLLLRRPPGREAYPGDIFFIHSRLLERSSQLTASRGGGSMTALPVVETQAQDISAYIPTNLISITDGQIYLSPTLFHKGMLPAIDVGRSVSRVGGKTQLPEFRRVSGDLRLSYSQFEELETFARFATRLDPRTRATIEHGRRVREVLKQPEHQLLGASEQIAVLAAVNAGLFDDIPLESIPEAERAVRDAVSSELHSACRRMESGESLSDDDRREMVQVAQRAVQSFSRESA